MIILYYLDGPYVITRVFINGRGGAEEKQIDGSKRKIWPEVAGSENRVMVP